MNTTITRYTTQRIIDKEEKTSHKISRLPRLVGLFLIKALIPMTPDKPARIKNIANKPDACLKKYIASTDPNMAINEKNISLWSTFSCTF